MGYDDDQLDTGQGGATYPPTLKLPDAGNTLTFAIIAVKGDVPQTIYGTDQPLLNSRGKQKMATAITVLVTKSEGATIGKIEESRPAVAGDVGTIWVTGYMKFDPDQDKLGGTYLSWGGAVDKLGKTNFRVGTVGQWKHLGELPSRGTFPRVNRKFSLRAAKPEEAAQSQQCQVLRNELSSETPVTVPATSGLAPDEDLF